MLPDELVRLRDLVDELIWASENRRMTISDFDELWDDFKAAYRALREEVDRVPDRRADPGAVPN